MSEEHESAHQEDDSIDWKSLLERKDRPLPKKGCSWAFYLFLLALLLLLLFFYLRYLKQ